MKFLASNIRWLRKSNGWEQEDLAKKLGVSSSVISNWERAENGVKPTKVAELCKIFSITMEDLYNKDLSGGSSTPHAGDGPDKELDLEDITASLPMSNEQMLKQMKQMLANRSIDKCFGESQAEIIKALALQIISLRQRLEQNN